MPHSSALFGRMSLRRLKILLDEPGTQVYVELHQRRIADGFEAVDLARLDHEDISRTALESLVADHPHAAAFADELNLVIRMTMRRGSRSRFAMEQEHRNPSVSLFNAAKLV